MESDPTWPATSWRGRCSARCSASPAGPTRRSRVLDGVWERPGPSVCRRCSGCRRPASWRWCSRTGRLDRLRRLLTEVAPLVQAAEDRWGSATAPGIARLRTVEGVLAHRDGDLDRAAALLRRAADLARTYGEPPGIVAALTALAEVELDAPRPRGGPRRPRARLGTSSTTSRSPPPFVHRLEAVEQRAGRAAVRDARRGGALVEELTDREQAILRALSGDATQREIGAALYLSINTVKGYTKVLYRKLGVATRQDAVREARALGLL